jgi:hypothetical protein
LSSFTALALGRMLVSFCSDACSAATSSHTAEVDAELDPDGTVLPGEGLPGEGLLADAGPPAGLPLELQAPASSTRLVSKLDSRMFRQGRRLSVNRLILRERGSGWPDLPHTRRVISPRTAAGGEILFRPAHGCATSVTVAVAE